MTIGARELFVSAFMLRLDMSEAGWKTLTLQQKQQHIGRLQALLATEILGDQTRCVSIGVRDAGHEDNTAPPLPAGTKGRRVA